MFFKEEKIHGKDIKKENRSDRFKIIKNDF